MYVQENTDMDDQEKNEPLSAVLKQFRKHNQISQESLARHLDMSWKTIARYEAGEPLSAASILRLIKFCETLQQERFAQLFRRAYVSEIGSGGIDIALVAESQLVIVAGLLNAVSGAVSDLEVKQLLYDAIQGIFSARKKLNRILPLRPDIDDKEWKEEVEAQEDRAALRNAIPTKQKIESSKPPSERDPKNASIKSALVWVDLLKSLDAPEFKP
jgi:DNA-binding XRE family transcriptional regulator